MKSIGFIHCELRLRDPYLLQPFDFLHNDLAQTLTGKAGRGACLREVVAEGTRGNGGGWLTLLLPRYPTYQLTAAKAQVIKDRNIPGRGWTMRFISAGDAALPGRWLLGWVVMHLSRPHSRAVLPGGGRLGRVPGQATCRTYAPRPNSGNVGGRAGILELI